METLAGTFEPFLTFHPFFSPANQLFRFLRHQLDELQCAVEIEYVRNIGNSPSQVSLFPLRHRREFTAGCLLSLMSLFHLLDAHIHGGQAVLKFVRHPFQLLDCGSRRVRRLIGLSRKLRPMS